MLISLTSVLGVLAVVIIGVLVMIQVLQLEAIGEWFARAWRVIFLGVLGWFLLRCVLLPIFTCALVWLKYALSLALVAALVVFTAIVSVKLLLKVVKHHVHSKKED